MIGWVERTENHLVSRKPLGRRSGGSPAARRVPRNQAAGPEENRLAAAPRNGVQVMIVWMALQSLWHFLFGWAGIDILIGFAAVAVAALMPTVVVAFIPDLRKWAIGVAVVAFTLTGAIAYGYKNGSDEKQRQWDAGLSREIVDGNEVLAGAVRDAARATPDSVRNDRWNRDNWKK